MTQGRSNQTATRRAGGSRATSTARPTSAARRPTRSSGRTRAPATARASGTGRSAGTSRGTATPARPGRAQPPTRPPRPARPGRPPREPGRPERRQRWLMAITTLIVVLFVGRLVQVQVFEGPALAQAARDERMRSTTVLAHRGDITDADGVVLATSVDRYTIVADQQAIADFTPRDGDVVDGEPLTEGGAVGVAKLLAPVLGRSAPELAADLNGESRYKVLQHDVVPEVQRAIADLGLGAYVITEPTSERTYPADTVAGNLVGYVNSSQEGMGGIESAYDDVLAGTAGSRDCEVGLGGQLIPTGECTAVDPVPGEDVRLTLSRDVQWKAQDSVDRAVRESGSDYGIAVVEKVGTGEILALADSGTVNPNNRETDAVSRPSRAVSNVFDPGSTGKVVTMAAALEGGYAKVDSQFEVPFMYTTENGQTFRDSHEHGVERLTLAGVLAESSNTGTVQVGEKIPRQVRYDYLHKFGFGQYTGLGLPGESAGILHPADSWDGRTEYAVLFGQSVSVNAVQATSVFATVANGGLRMTPRVVAGTTDVSGDLAPLPADEPQRVVSQETADTVLHMMESVVEEGTGAAAEVPGYRVAGKTGTAEAAGADGKLSGIMASFIGVAPADDPQYTVSVFLKNPRTSIYGGVVAAPVFSDIMGFTLEHEGVPPSSEPYVPLPTTW
ncbi:peptidoglycan D,D-transpeptidase FtsI family protein [Cellulosimicrobium arenosum]|uniref:Penicillin-binding protein 2 n=1 Tax=Cellulosimicrobium arenosum TaxID=2708133 RepID=A0A927G960_9MICO|nr:penicillin-binding protein 2 [Cellulosimicrobium arenosum]MBD8079199.1 penicillin-binding protein 2 [Cellulosimicrobium arenosum]